MDHDLIPSLGIYRVDRSFINNINQYTFSLQVVIAAIRGNGYAADIAIDNVKLETGSCTETFEEPDNLDILNCNYDGL